MDNHQMKALVDALESKGWTRPLIYGGPFHLAQRAVDGLGGRRMAHVRLTPGDCLNRSLLFEWISEGINVTAADVALIPIAAAPEEITRRALAAADRANHSIEQSFGVRFAR